MARKRQNPKKIPEKWKEPIGCGANNESFDPWVNPGDAVFCLKTARAVVKWFPANLKLSQGRFAGKRFKLELWQERIIGHMFAWKRPDGTRRFSSVWIYIPRKNGKTTFAAGQTLILYDADGEMGAQVYTAAAEKDQAAIVFNEAASMVAQNEDMDARITVYKSYKSMFCTETNSTMKVLSSEADTKHGLNPSAFVVDEVHAQKKPDLMEVLETGTGSRLQPMEIYLTTSDFDRESPCNEKHEYAKNVRDGIISDSTMLPAIWEASLEDDWTSEKTWKKANPNYGVSLTKRYMEKMCKKAQRLPSFQNTFKRLNLNIRTSQQSVWILMDDWNSSGSPDLQPEELLGQRCWGGLDLAETTDLTALTLFFPDTCSFLCWFWIPESAATDDRGRIRKEYQVWIDKGYLEVTPGAKVDYDVIRRKVSGYHIVNGKEAHDEDCIIDNYDVKDIAYDRYNASQIVIDLAERDGVPMVEFGQGFISMSSPSKQLEAHVKAQEINHFNNPVLRWMVSNAQIKEDPAGNIKPVKPNRSSRRKIDGLVAGIMAIGRFLVFEPPENTTSKYDTEEMLVI